MLEAVQLRREDVDRHKEELRGRINALEASQRKVFYERFKRELKDPDTYAVLNYFFLAGLHHMYLGKFLRGSLNFFILMFGLGLMIGGFPVIGLFLMVLILLMELMALFRSEVIVNHHNNQRSEDILALLEPRLR
ncbi:MAG: TM2 domain-containing protein [Gammaproteobacteria bacterium]|nr:TM2 domain-containing protein [Gammaproteobacteria bacterium]